MSVVDLVDCAATQRRLAQDVTARLDRVQAELAGHQRRAAAAPAGGAEWAGATQASVSLVEEAARLQAVAGALAEAMHDGPCTAGCACTAALATPAAGYRFPGGGLTCDITADGGDVWHRIGGWQQLLARVTGRESLPEGGTGMVLRFPLDADLAADLARLAAAEYRCCSFGSYTMIADGHGLRLEIRMPAEAAGMLAAVVGHAGSNPATAVGHAENDPAAAIGHAGNDPAGADGQDGNDPAAATGHAENDPAAAVGHVRNDLSAVAARSSARALTSNARGDVEGPSGHVEPPSGDVERPSGDVERPSGDVERPSGEGVRL